MSNHPPSELPVAEVLVGARVRKDFGNVLGLAESINRVGLLHPLVLNSRHELIAGARRLKAVKKLGWKTVPVRIVDSLDDATVALKAELYENTDREPLKPTELDELAKKLEEIEGPKAKERQGRPGEARSANFAEQESKGRAREKVAEAVGTSHETLRKIREVQEAAAADPERFGDLPERMDSNGKVDPVYKELRKRQKAGTTKGETLKDQLGKDVPSNLRDLFGDPWLFQCGEAIETFARDALKSVRSRVEKRGDRYGTFLLKGAILKALDAAKGELDTALSHLTEARPYAVCPACEGTKCKTCRERGWLPKWRYLELRAEKKV